MTLVLLIKLTILFVSQGLVTDPIMMLIDLAAPNYAVYLERLIPSTEFSTFLCENSNDANKVMNILRKDKGLKRINVAQLFKGKIPNSPNVPGNITLISL